MAKQKNVPITSAARPASAPASDDKGKLGVLALAGVVVSSMIGGGIYSLPQNMAAGASVGAVIWRGLSPVSAFIFWRIRSAFCRWLSRI